MLKNLYIGLNNKDRIEVMEDSDPLDLQNGLSSQLEEKIELPERDVQELFYANSDKILHKIEKNTGLYIAGRESYLTLRGNKRNVLEGKKVIENIISLFQDTKKIDYKDVSFIINRVKNNINFNIGKLQEKQITIGPNGKIITPKSMGQARYFEAIESSDLTFSIGPAGTGKTYLAMAFALH